MNLVVVFAVAVAVCAPAFRGPFLIDDMMTVVGNKDVGHRNNWTDLWKNDYWGTPVDLPSSHKSYRPVTVLLLRVLYRVSEQLGIPVSPSLRPADTIHNPHANPLVFKIAEALCHGIASVLVAIVAKRAFDENSSSHASWRLPWISPHLIAALLFAVHPVHIEAIVNPTGIAEPLAFVIGILCFLCHERVSRGGSGGALVTGIAYLSALVLACAATTAKETGILFLAAAVAADVFRNGLLRLGVLFRALVALALFAANVALRIKFMGANMTPKFTSNDNFLPWIPSMVTRVMTAVAIHGHNYRLLFWPMALSTDYSPSCIVPVESWMDRYFLIGLGCHLVVFGGILVALIKGNRMLATVLAWLVLLLLPASHVVLVGTVIAERILYSPSMPACILLALMYKKLVIVSNDNSAVVPKHSDTATIDDEKSNTESIKSESSKHSQPPVRFRGAVLFLFSALIAVFATRAATRSDAWNSDDELFTQDSEICPTSVRTLVRLGNIQFRHDNFEAALPFYHQALDHSFEKGEYWLAYSMIANVQTRLGNTEKATENYGLAAALSPYNHEVHERYGNGLYISGNYLQAELSFRRALSLENFDFAATLGLANTMSKLNSTAEAEQLYERSFELIRDPQQLEWLIKFWMASLNEHGLFDKAEALVRRFMGNSTATSHNTKKQLEREIKTINKLKDKERARLRKEEYLRKAEEAKKHSSNKKK